MTNTTQSTQTVFTAIIKQGTVSIIDVQVKPAVVVRPLPCIRPVYGGESSVEVTTEVQQAVETTVFTSAIIKKEFKSSKIVEIKTSTTELVTNYQVTVVNADNQTAVVDLVEEVGQPITIINVHTDIVSAVIVTKEETVKTEVVVQAVTGNKVVVTNDQQVIKTDISVTHVTQNIFAQVPVLIGCLPVSVSTTTYGTIKETTIVMQSSDSTLTQVTTIVNTLTN